MVTDKKRVTLQDIAERSGYSVNTVSHALRNKSDISRETCQRIQDIAREMGYTGNQIARSLRSGRTHMIAVIVGGLSNPFYGIMAEAIQNAAKAKGYTVMIMCSEEDPQQEMVLAEEAVARCADGILLFPSCDSQTTINHLKESGMPFVLVSRTVGENVADCVLLDESQGAYLAARHLIDSGKRKLAYISRNTVLYSSEHRIQGFNKACDEAGIPESDRTYLTASTMGLDVTDNDLWLDILMKKLTELKPGGLNGLFVFCDVEAWHVMNALDRSDSVSRTDFGIVSIDNLESALSFPLPLCSVGYSFKSIAENSIRLLRSRIHGDMKPPEQIVVPVELVCRGSCHRS